MREEAGSSKQMGCSSLLPQSKEANSSVVPLGQQGSVTWTLNQLNPKGAQASRAGWAASHLLPHCMHLQTPGPSSLCESQDPAHDITALLWPA